MTGDQLLGLAMLGLFWVAGPLGTLLLPRPWPYYGWLCFVLFVPTGALWVALKALDPVRPDVASLAPLVGAVVISAGINVAAVLLREVATALRRRRA